MEQTNNIDDMKPDRPILYESTRLSGGLIIDNQSKTVREQLGKSVFDKMQHSSNPMEKLIHGLTSAGVQVHKSGHSITATLEGQTLHLPSFDKHGRMFHKGTLYNAVGGVIMDRGQGMVERSLQDTIYEQANKVSMGGKSPHAKFHGAKDVIDSMFKQSMVNVGGRMERMSAGQSAGLFDVAYQTDQQVRRGISMRERRVVLAGRGSEVFTELAREAEAMQTMVGSSVRRARMNRAGTAINVGGGDNMSTSVRKWEVTRKRAIEAVQRMDPRYNFFAASQSGRSLFDRDAGQFPLLGAQGGDYRPVTVSLASAHRHLIDPAGFELNKGIHQMVGQSYIPLPGRLDGVRRNPFPLVTPVGYGADLRAAKSMTGHMGAFSLGMDVGVIADPEVRRMIHSKSGAMATSPWAVHALSDNTYRVKVRMGPEDDAFKYLLDKNLRDQILRTQKETGGLEYGGSILGQPFNKGRGIKLSSGMIGAHVGADGTPSLDIKPMVRPENMNDRVIGFHIKKDIGEVEFVLRGKRKMTLGTGLTVSGERVSLDKVRTLQLEGSGAHRGLDLLADIDPKNTGLHLQTVAQRTHERMGESGLRMMAQAFGADFNKVFDTYQTIEGGTQGVGSYKQGMANFETALKEQMRSKGASKAQIAAEWQQLTNLEFAMLSPQQARAMFESRGIKINPEIAEQIAREGLRVHMFRGVDVSKRAGMEVGKKPIKFKFPDVRLLSEALAGSAAGNAKDTKLFSEYSQNVHRAYRHSNPHLDDLYSIAKSYGSAPTGVSAQATTHLKPLPVGFSQMDEISIKDAKGTILLDENGKLRNRGFNVQLKDKMHVSGNGANWIPTQASDLFYMPSAATAGFYLDEKAGVVKLSGGPRSAEGGISMRRAWLSLWESAQTGGGFEKLDTQGLKGRMDALYGTLMESVIGKGGEARQSSIQGVVSAQGRQGYLASLGEGEIGIPESRMRSIFGDKIYTEAMQEQVKKGQDLDLYVMSRRHPSRSVMQLRSMRVKVLQANDLASASVLSRAGSELDMGDMLYTSRTMQYLTQGDLDGDTIEAFLLTPEGGQLGHEQKTLARLYALQQKQTDRVTRNLLNLKTIQQFGDIADEQHLGVVSKEFTDDMLARASSRSTSNAASGGHLFDVAQPKALAPLAETFFRARSEVAREMSRLVDGAINEREAIATLSKWAGKELSEEGLNIARDLVKSDTAMLAGEMRSVVDYATLTKAANETTGKAELSLGLMDKLVQYGKEVGQSPSSLDDPMSNMVEDITDDLYKLYDAEQAVRDKQLGLPKSQFASLILNDRDLASESTAKEAMRRRAKVALGVEGLMAREGIESTFDIAASSSMNAERAAAQGSSAAVKAFSILSEMFGDNFSEQEYLDGLEESVKARGAAEASMRQQRSSAAYDAAAEGAMAGNNSISSRAGQTAELGMGVAKRLAQSKFFKPAMVGLGALAGWEAVKGVVSGVSSPTTHTPTTSLPPTPMVHGPSDGAFDYKSIPHNNVSRIARVDGQRTHLSVQGSSAQGVDYRSVTSSLIGSHGFQPVQNGVLRDERSGETSRRDVERYLQQRIASAY